MIHNAAEECPAIVVIAYNRAGSLRRLLCAIERASYPRNDIPLIISIDYSDNNQEVCRLAEDFVWRYGKKYIRKYKKNIGLKRHFMKCADYSLEFGAAIIFEDDVVPSNGYYKYILSALGYYKNDDRIMAIALYSQKWNGYANLPFEPLRYDDDVFISQIECSWGECYIGGQWREFRKWYKAHKNMNFQRRGDIPWKVLTWRDSYSKYIIHYFIDRQKYFVTPYESYATNFSDVGTHATMANTSYQTPLFLGKGTYRFPTFENAVKYDIFHENINVKEVMEKKLCGKVCMDLAGIRLDYVGYDFCITTKTLPYQVMESYALQMRPWELNILYKISGRDIFVYDLQNKKLPRLHPWHRFNVVKYHTKDMSVLNGAYYVCFEFIRKMVLALKLLRRTIKKQFNTWKC